MAEKCYKKLEAALIEIADGDAQNWPGCSSRRVAAVALGREEGDINHHVELEAELEKIKAERDGKADLKNKGWLTGDRL